MGQLQPRTSLVSWLKREVEDDKAHEDSQSLQPKVRKDDSGQISLAQEII